MTKKLKIDISAEIGAVSALLQMPEKAAAMLVLAHGAGAGMEHEFMQQLADALALQKIATLRFNFPFMEKGGAPDRPPKAQASVVAATQTAIGLAKGLPILVGGKSFGGRMSSHCAAMGQLPAQVKGIVYLGFPLHAAGKPGKDRAAHLSEIALPQLFLQGTKDTLAQIDLIQEVCQHLGQTTLVQFEEADHSFKTPKRSGISAEAVMARLASEIAAFAQRIG